jgi:hypothetical protein
MKKSKTFIIGGLAALAGWSSGVVAQKLSGREFKPAVEVLWKDRDIKRSLNKWITSGFKNGGDFQEAAAILHGYDADRLYEILGALRANRSPSAATDTLDRLVVEELLARDPWKCLGHLLEDGKNPNEVKALLEMAVRHCASSDPAKTIGMIRALEDYSMRKVLTGLALENSDASELLSVFGKIRPEDRLGLFMKRSLGERWAAADPEQFLGYAREVVTNPAMYEAQERSVLQSLIKSDFEKALEMVQGDVGKRGYGTSLSLLMVINEAPEDKLEQVKAIIEGLPPGTDRVSRVGQLAERYANLNMELAYEFADSLSGPERNMVLKVIGKSLGEGSKDAQALASALNDLPTGALALEVVQGVMAKKSRAGVEDAWAIASQLENPVLRGSALDRVVSEWVWHNPESALKQILGVSAGGDALLDTWARGMRTVAPLRYEDPMKAMVGTLGDLNNEDRSRIVTAVRKTLTEAEIKEMDSNPVLKGILGD